MKINSLLLVRILCLGLAVTAVAASFPPAHPVRRFASITGLRPEKAAYYEQLHAHPWPGVMRMIKACHIRNYSIYVREIDGKPYLFSYFEYVGDDFAADMNRMSADPETQRWWKETAPCQIPLPDAAKAGKTWSDAREVFHLP